MEKIKENCEKSFTQCREYIIEQLSNIGKLETPISTHRQCDETIYEECVIVEISNGIVYYDNGFEHLSLLSMNELYNIFNSL